MIPIRSASSLERALELLVGVHLDERVEVELARLGEKLGELVGLERRDDQQHRVGAGDAASYELVAVDDEVLAQDRERRSPRARRAGRRATRRSVLLGEDRERGRAAALVGADDPATVAPARISPARRRAALELGDHGGARARERLHERPPRPGAGRARARRAAARACGRDASSRVASDDRVERVTRRRAAPAPAPRRRSSAPAAPRRSPRRRPSTPSRSSLPAPAGVDRGAGVQQREVARAAPCSPARIARAIAAFSSGVPPPTASSGAALEPASSGSTT